jgi:hypothetical protein
MPRITSHQEQQGFLTIAQNTVDTDYLKLAYVQAMSIKLVMPQSKYAVLVDHNTLASVTEQHRRVFDYVITIDNDMAADETWKLSNEWQVFELTPFKETIKLESDIVFTRSIEHWWTAFRLRDIVLSTGCRDYRGQLSTARDYRRVFDDNQLPDVYNGLMYFRYTRTATQFFNIAQQIYANWDYVSQQLLKNCRDPSPTTDVVYALSAKILGVQLCTLPSADFINFTHMKPAINAWSIRPWCEQVVCETDLPMLRIANQNQYHPVHYHDKTWVTDDIVKEYEHEFFR